MEKKPFESFKLDLIGEDKTLAGEEVSVDELMS